MAGSMLVTHLKLHGLNAVVWAKLERVGVLGSWAEGAADVGNHGAAVTYVGIVHVVPSDL